MNQLKSVVFLLIVASTPLFFSCKTGKSSAKKANIPPRMELTESQSRKFEYYFLEGQRLKISQQPDAAFDMFFRCEEIDSTSAIVSYELADLYLKMGNAVQGLEKIRKVNRLAPDNFWYQYTFANLAQNLNLLSEAEKIYLKLADQHPDKPELNYSLVEIYSQNKEFKKAIAQLDKLEGQMGLTEEISIEKFRLYAVLKDSKHAFAELDKLAHGFPNEIRYRLLLGDMYLENGNPKEAFENYEKASLIEPENGYLASSLANYYEKIGNKEEAENQIRKALLNPKIDLETKNRILASYLSTRLEKPEEAKNIESLFDGLIEMHPQEDSFYQLYGDYLITQKKLPQAKEKLQFAVGLEPTNANSWKSLLNVNLQLMDYKGVVETCSKALEYLPSAAEFYYYQGIGHFLSEEYEPAIASFQNGLKVIDPKNVVMLSDFNGQIGDVYQRMAKYDECFAAYETALKYNEKNILVLNNYAYNLSLLKRDLGKAEQMSGKTIAADPNNSTYLDTYAWVYFVQENYVLAKFYIEKALKNGGDKSDVIVEHYGDILVKGGNVEKGVEQWLLSQKMGNSSELLKKKIATKTYIPEPLPTR